MLSCDHYRRSERHCDKISIYGSEVSLKFEEELYKDLGVQCSLVWIVDVTDRDYEMRNIWSWMTQ